MISVAKLIAAENLNDLPTFECLPGIHYRECIIYNPITSKTKPDFKVSYAFPDEIKFVEIKGGNLAVFTSTICDYFPNLIEITLENTNVEELNESALQTCKNMMYWTLKGGKVEEIPLNFFKNIPLLNHIELTDIPIKKIDPAQFHEIPALRRLLITFTPIEEFPLESVSSDKIIVMFLNSNNLKDFPAEEYKKKFPIAQGVAYGDNDINCSRVQEMNDFLKEQGVNADKSRVPKPREEEVGEVEGVICIP